MTSIPRTNPLYGTRWAIAGLRNGWKMPTAPWWKRLPVIRHVRVMYHAARLVIWEDFWTRAGYVPNGYDDWVLAGMWRGWEERRPAGSGSREGHQMLRSTVKEKCNV
jgi:hypothetical protein